MRIPGELLWKDTEGFSQFESPGVPITLDENEYLHETELNGFRVSSWAVCGGERHSSPEACLHSSDALLMV